MYSSTRRDRIPVVAWFAVLLAAFLAPSALFANFAATQSVEKDGQLKFEYRLEPEAEVESVGVTQNGKNLEARHTPFANNPLAPGAILVMVDTSAGNARAPRDRTVAQNKTFVEVLMAEAQPQDLVGVYGFANDLAEIVPLARAIPNIQSKLAGLKADGLGTRIYRQGIQGIELLAATPAARKTLVILSDGKDEDNGFTREDLVKSALAHGVAICAMGCPETGVDIPALGNLEKMTAETHGLYAQAKIGEGNPAERLRVNSAFARAVLGLVNSGGEIALPLDGLAPSGDVVFSLKTKTGETFTYLHERATAEAGGTAAAPSLPAVEPAAPLPAAQASVAATATPTPAAEPSVAASPAPRPAPKPPAVQKNNAAARLISTGSIVMLVLAVVLLRRRSAAAKKTAPEPVASLLMQDAESRRIPLTGIATRIGRRPDNDIVFANTSVSGYHAEIHVQRDGGYLLTDLGSGNGLKVNGQPVSQSALKDGDLVEMGEVRFRFHLSSN